MPAPSSAMKRANKSQADRNAKSDLLMSAAKSARMTVNDDGYIQFMPSDYLKLFDAAYELLDQLDELYDCDRSEAVNEEIFTVREELKSVIDRIKSKLESESDINAHRHASSKLVELQTLIFLVD